jgi:hypothetical protein
MIIRHPQEQELLDGFNQGKLGVAIIMLGAGYKCTPSNPEKVIQTDEQLSQILSVCDRLASYFGESIGLVAGKYQQAEFFAFQSQGETIIVAAENSGKGATWYLAIPKNHRHSIPKNHYISLEHPAVIHVLPAFFTELYELFFQKDLEGAGFSHEANQLRQLWRTEPQRQDLDQSTPVVKSMSPRRSL